MGDWRADGIARELRFAHDCDFNEIMDGVNFLLKAHGLRFENDGRQCQHPGEEVFLLRELSSPQRKQCPKCKSHSIKSTTMGGRQGDRNLNQVTCCACGEVGVAWEWEKDV